LGTVLCDVPFDASETVLGGFPWVVFHKTAVIAVAHITLLHRKPSPERNERFFSAQGTVLRA
jgi:hypothetical protein